jgi:D-sedoheptulose 7-phosphate isomerase
MLKSQILVLQNNLDELLKDKELLDKVDSVIRVVSSALIDKLPVLVFGNGGSASDAMHICGELVGKFKKNRRPLNVICLNSNVSVITAWSNDFNFDTIYSRQVEAHSVENGICWGISTSGNSTSVVNALKRAKELKMVTISLTGQNGGKSRIYSDYLINVPGNETPRIQELHLPVYHYICEKIEDIIAKEL